MPTIVGVDEKAKKRLTCRNCANIIEYTPSDLTTWATSSCGERGTASGFDCPSCKVTIVVKSS